jgi:type IV pilus assembly protein PilY1
MKASTQIIRRLIPALLGVSLATVVGIAQAAPGTLSNSPLYLSTVVLPNIIFLLDDSGTMDYGLITEENGGMYTIGTTFPSEWQYRYAHPLHSNIYNKAYHTYGHTLGIELFAYTLPSQALLDLLQASTFTFDPGTPADPSDDVAVTNLMSTYYSNWDGVWRTRNASYNNMYYNPAITYEPWKGTDTTGAYFADSPPTAALLDPYLGAAAAGNTQNLTTDINFISVLPNFSDPADIFGFGDSLYPASYYTWTDTNGNGQVDASDAHTLVEIKPATPSYTGGNGRLDCTAAPTCTYAEEIQNFANWFSYYRSRMHSAKNAVSSMISNTASARVGYVRSNYYANDGETDNQRVEPMNNDASSGAKKAVLDKLFLTIPDDTSNTSLRLPLQNIGEYLENTKPYLFVAKVTGKASQLPSPILSAANGGQCQQNFSVVVTDGFYNGSAPSPSVGNADGDASTTFDGGDYADSVSDTLADVAMHYYERDLSTTLANDVPTKTGIDEADHQHMVTYTVAFGITGTLDPYDSKTPGDLTDSDPSDAGFAWPTFDPNDALVSSEKIDDLWHTAFNGRGQFLSAQNPEALGSTITNALLDITGRTSSAAAVAFNSTSLGTGSVVYLARFNSVTWEGELLAYDLDPFSGSVSATPNWNASDSLDAQTPASRVIYTSNSSTGQGLPFKTLGSLPANQQNDLNMGPIGVADGLGQARLDYLRGTRTHEGAGYNFRIRSGVLGDIVHANPIYVGEPQMNFPDTAPYGDATQTTVDGDGNTIYTHVYSYFKNSYKNRTGVVYVGSNDGMLHGFHEDTGAEVMAYTPNILFSALTNEGLHYLSNPAYVHRYHIDLSPTVADAFIKTTPAGAVNWKTVIVGGLRGGGRGLFALDVTDPSAYTDANADDVVMWEFTDDEAGGHGDLDLGATFSKPTISLLKNNRWAAVVGNGYNDNGDGMAKLFILFLDGGLDGTWTAGSDYIEISTATGDPTNKNGLSTPALIDSDGDGYHDRVYAGDLRGNLWVFDLNATATGSWGLAYAKPLLTAADGLGNAQPITTKPVVVKHPTITTANANKPNLLVFVGTGQFLVDADKTSTGEQTMYGVWDDGPNNASLPYTRADLLAQGLEASSTAITRVPTSLTVDYSSEKGWYFDLPDTGERIVVNPKIRGDYVFFNTLIPETTACSYGGYGWLMALTQLDGSRPLSTSVFDTNNDGMVDDNDKLAGDAAGGMRFGEGLPAESNFLSDNQYTPGSTGNLEQGAINAGTTIEAGRMSWREIIVE